MYSTGMVQYQRLAKYLKDQAQQVGIDLVPQPFEWSVVITKLTNRDFDATVMSFSGGVLFDIYDLFHSSQIGEQGCNYFSFRNAEADAITEQIRRTLDETKRNQLCQKLHGLLHEEQPYTFLFIRPTLRLIDRRFENIKIYNLGPKYWQWYVPKELQRYK